MTQLWTGKEVNDSWIPELKTRVDTLSHRGIIPRLAVYRTKEGNESASYLRGIRSKFSLLNMEVVERGPFQTAGLDALCRSMREDAEDLAISGMMPFFPLPEGWDKEIVRDLIPREKDVDGMRLESLGAIVAREEGFSNCAVDSILRFIDHFQIDLIGKRIALFGAGALIGRPLLLRLLERGATVSVINSKTIFPEEIALSCDMLIGCSGSPGVINAGTLRSDHIVLDAATSYVGGVLRGDLDPKAYEIPEAITPVPGGIASVTTTALAWHTIQAAERLNHARKDRICEQ